MTRIEGQAYTRFGISLDDEDTETQLAGVGELATRAVDSALQAVLWDPVAGSNGLWSFLRQIAQPSLPSTDRVHHRSPSPVRLVASDRPQDHDLEEAT